MVSGSPRFGTMRPAPQRLRRGSWRESDRQPRHSCRKAVSTSTIDRHTIAYWLTTSERMRRMRPGPAMDLRLDRHEKEGIQILDLRGHLKAGNSEASLRATIDELVKASALNVILNLAEVTTIDADGLEALVFCYTRTREC